MDIRVKGPDGRIVSFPEGTSNLVIKDAMDTYYGVAPTQKYAQASALKALARGTSKRTEWQRFFDDTADVIQTSPAMAGFRQGYKEGAYADTAPAKPANAIPDSPFVSLGHLSGAMNGIQDVLTGDKTASTSKQRADAAITKEAARRASFQTASEADPWYKADHPIAHGADALTATLAGAALDPLSYLSGGRSVLGRAFTQGIIATAGDYGAQKSDVAVGLQKDISKSRLALSAAAGSLFSGVSDFASLGPKKWGREFFASAENDAREVLKVADKMAVPPMTSSEIGTPAKPFKLSSEAPAPVAPDPAKIPSEPLKDPSKAPAVVDGSPPSASAPKDPAGDPWANPDFGNAPEPRKAAALKHLDTLRQTIKPEHTNDFLAWVMKDLPPGGEAPTLNGKVIDWQKFSDKPELYASLREAMAEIFSDTYTAHSDKVRTWKSTTEAANLMGTSLTDVIHHHATFTGEGGISARIVALKNIMLAHQDQFEIDRAKLLSDMERGDYSGLEAFTARGHEFAHLDAMLRNAESETGRTLNILKQSKQAARLNNDLKNQMASFNEAFGGGITDPDKLKGVLEKMGEAYKKGGPAKSMEHLRHMRQMGAWDYIGYIVTGNILSGTWTHIRNLTGTPIHATFEVASRYVAAGVGSLRQATGMGPKDRVTFREANSHVFAAAESAQDALKIGWQAFKKGGVVTDGVSSVLPDANPHAQVPFAITPERRAQWAQQGATLGTGLDIALHGWFAAVRTFGYRPSIAADEFYKTMARRAEVTSQALREAHYRSQLVDVDKRQAVFTKTVDGLKNEPTAFAAKAAHEFFAETGLDRNAVFDPGTKAEDMALILKSVDIRRMAQDYAQLLTFQKSGPIINQFDQALRMVPLVKYGYVNFLRTPSAILKVGMVDYMPGMNLLAKDNRKALSAYTRGQEEALARGGAEADLVVGRMVVGIGLLGLAWTLAASGANVGKRSKEEERDGVLSYSVKLPNGTWVQYTGASPLAELLGIVADTQRAFVERDIQEDHAEALMGGLIAAFTNNVTNKSFLSGVGDFMDMLEGPGYAVNDTTRAGQVTAGLAKTVIPRVIPLSSMQRIIAQDHDPIVREARTFLEQIIATTPELSKTLPEKRDFLGRPIIRPEGQHGIGQAFKTSTATKDPLEIELGRLAQSMPDFKIDVPDRSFNGSDLKSAEYSKLLEVQGQKVKHPVTGMNMEESLRAMIQSPTYADMGNEERAYRLKKVITTFRLLGKRSIMDPNSPNYMGEMVRRTAVKAAEVDAKKKGLSPDQAAQRAGRYGLRPSDAEMEQLRSILSPTE